MKAAGALPSAPRGPSASAGTAPSAPPAAAARQELPLNVSNAAAVAFYALLAGPSKSSSATTPERLSASKAATSWCSAARSAWACLDQLAGGAWGARVGQAILDPVNLLLAGPPALRCVVPPQACCPSCWRRSAWSFGFGLTAVNFQDLPRATTADAWWLPACSRVSRAGMRYAAAPPAAPRARRRRGCEGQPAAQSLAACALSPRPRRRRPSHAPARSSAGCRQTTSPPPRRGLPCAAGRLSK